MLGVFLFDFKESKILTKQIVNEGKFESIKDEAS